MLAHPDNLIMKAPRSFQPSGIAKVRKNQEIRYEDTKLTQ